MTVRRVAVVVNVGKPEAAARAREIAQVLVEEGIAVSEEEPDLVVSLGGDGTMLRGAQLAHAADVPLLGVNLGTLGYLTEVDATHEVEALRRVLAGDYDIQDRMMLACSVEPSEEVGPFVALNEVLVERAARQRLVRLGVRVGGESLGDFNADGVIVATPTGSTAYALSAGGPIVSPRAECLVVVPVSAHMVFSRPFVLAADEVVEITVRDSGPAASLSLDGHLGCELTSGATVVVRRHERPLKLVRLGGPRFIERLRTKMNL
ncbi:MAG: NAD(+)/NADH kinase, partial [Actinomycetota bacterium]|nr:NAD(+)/NADH kinase [Actinomycetota bacterium]